MTICTLCGDEINGESTRNKIFQMTVCAECRDEIAEFLKRQQEEYDKQSVVHCINCGSDNLECEVVFICGNPFCRKCVFMLTAELGGRRREGPDDA